NIAERGGDHAADTEIHQRPRRVLTRRAAPEIVTGNKDLGLAISRLVEHEFRIFAAVVFVAAFGEQTLAETGALDGLQILLWDHHVGIDIDDVQWGGNAFEPGELFHGLSNFASGTLEQFCFLRRRVFWSIAEREEEVSYAHFDGRGTSFPGFCECVRSGKCRTLVLS